MKRYFALLLLLALLFTGCGRKAQVPVEPTPSTTLQPSSPPEEITEPSQPETEPPVEEAPDGLYAMIWSASIDSIDSIKQFPRIFRLPAYVIGA